MKHIILALVWLFASACGAPIEDDALEGEELGTLEQALTWPSGFGWKKSGFARCSPQTNCNRPVDREIFFRFYAGTCNSWWQARVVASEDSWHNTLEDLGWDVNYSSTTADVYVECADAGNNLEVMVPAGVSNPDANGNSTFRGGTVKIDVAAIESQASWAGKTDVQRQRFAFNVIYHGLGHSIGLGHGGSCVSPCDQTVMSGVTGWYDTFPGYSASEHNWIADYVP